MLDREASRLAQLGGMARTDAPSMALVEAPGTSQAIATLHEAGALCAASSTPAPRPPPPHPSPPPPHPSPQPLPTLAS